MGRIDKLVGKAGDDKTPLRLTRLRSKVCGAPKLMGGLNARNRASESLPPDPVRMSAAAVLRKLPQSHPKRKPTFKVVGRLGHSPPTAPGQGGSVSEAKPEHGAEPKPAPAKKARAKRSRAKKAPQNKAPQKKAPQKKALQRKALQRKAPKKKIVVKWIKLERHPQTPPPKPFIPWPVRPDVESPPVLRGLNKVRTEGLFDIKCPGSHDSKPSGMPGARRLRSRDDYYLPARVPVPAPDPEFPWGQSSDKENFAPPEEPPSKRQRLSASADAVLPSIEDGDDGDVFRTPSVQSVEDDGVAVGSDFPLPDILPLTPESWRELSFEIYRDPSGSN